MSSPVNLIVADQELPEIDEAPLGTQGPRVLREGSDLTLVGCGYTTYQCEQAADELAVNGISAEVVDIRVLNPLDCSVIAESVTKTGRLCVADGGWRTCGMAGEVIAGVCEKVPVNTFKAGPVRLTLPDAPAPTSRVLEAEYYVRAKEIIETVSEIMEPGTVGSVSNPTG